MGDLGGSGTLYRLARIAALAAGCLALAHCSGGPGRIDPRLGVSASARVVPLGERAPKGGGVYKVGKPYEVAGHTYVPEKDPRNYHAVGYASWYGDDFHGRYTANGEIFDEKSISAASPVLPLPSYARVTNLRNHRSIVVRVNDRGPYAKGRILDVSRKTAKLLGFYDHGVTKVKVDYVGRAPLKGSSDRELLATLRLHQPSGESPVKVAYNGPFTHAYFDSRRMRDILPPERPYGIDSQNGTEVAAANLPVTRAPTTELAAAAKPQSAPPPQGRMEWINSAPTRSGQVLARAKRVPMPPVQPQPEMTAQATPQLSPVSAYAAPGYDGAAAGFMRGRGLY
jgi:rare lipoprotein A